MERKTKIVISIFVILTSLIVIYSIRNFSINTSQTGKLVLTGGSFLGLMGGGGVLFSLLFKEVRLGKEAAVGEEIYDIGFETLEAMAYKIHEIDSKHMKRDKRTKAMINGIAPYVANMIKNYQDTLHSLPKDLQYTITNIYTSAMGKHGHFNPYRAERYIKKLGKLDEFLLTHRPT